MSNQDDTQGGDASPDPNRAQELELWDRVLKRWNEHTARQIRNVGIAVSVVIALAGFFGIRSIDRMVEETMGKEVIKATDDALKKVEEDTNRLSTRLGELQADMIVEVAALKKEADKARALVDQVEEDGKRYKELDTALRARLAAMEMDAGRLEAIEADLSTRMDGLKAELANTERELKKSQETVRVVKADVGRANRLASSVALAAAPAQKSGPTEEIARLAPEEVRALRVRQVPDKLEKYDRSKRPIYLLNYSITVDRRATARNPDDLLDAIEKVTYQFDKRWFKRSEIERTNRADNFRLGMRVWGITEVGVRAKLTGRARPVCWSGLMSLDRPVMLKPLSTCPPS